VGDWNRFTENTGGTLVRTTNLMDPCAGEHLRVCSPQAANAQSFDERYDGRTPRHSDSL
jgi:hypothetical protein